MSEERIQLRFDGPELQAHEMDVTLLGNSLSALGTLCVEANRILNGENAKVKVVIKADIEANCVTLSLGVIQEIFGLAQTILANADISTAKQLLEWIGILKPIGAVAVGSLIPFLKWLKDNASHRTETTTTNNGDTVQVNIKGDNNKVFVIPKEVFALSKSSKIVESLKEFSSPITAQNGIEAATFIYKGEDQITIDATMAEELKEAYANLEDSEPQTFTAHIVVHTPTLDTQTKSKHWKFRMNSHVESLDISATSIYDLNPA